MSDHRVLMVHFQYPPDASVGAQITAKFAKYLPEFAWTPFVLTVKESYYAQTDPSTLSDVREWRRVYRTARLPHPVQGYRALKAFIGRHPLSGDSPQSAPGHPRVRSAFRRTLTSLLTLPDDLTGWLPPAFFRGLRLITAHRITHLFSSGPPWTNHLVAYLLCRATHLPWVACFEDPWTQVIRPWELADTSRLSLGLERRLERAVVSRAAAVVCLNDFHRDAMIVQYPHYRQGKFVTIPNGYDPDDFSGAEGGTSATSERFTVTHTGTIDYNRTPRHLFLAVQRLIASGTIKRDRLKIALIGDSGEVEGRTVATMAREHGLDDVVRVSPAVTREQAIQAMRDSHLLLVLAHDWVLQIPAKVYQYLRAGRPILALTPEGATADVVRQSGVGTVVDPYDVDGIATALGRRFSRFERGGHLEVPDPRFVAQFDRRRLTGMLAGLLEDKGEETSPKLGKMERAAQARGSRVTGEPDGL